MLATLTARADQEPDVRIAGPVSTKPLLTDVVRVMKQDKGLQIAIAVDLTNSEALEAVAQDKVGIALLTKALTLEDRAQCPGVDLVTIPVGMEVVALGISNDLWDAGLHTITRDAMRSIYEQKITNWRDVGGPDEKITLFNIQQGHGVWEILAEWLYGDNRKAPFPKVQYLATNEDVRNSLEFTPGSIGPLDASLVDGARCHALDIDLPDMIARPTAEDVAARKYPIVRPLIAVIVGRPTLKIRVVTDFLVGPGGQELVKKAGSFGAEAAPKPTPNPYY